MKKFSVLCLMLLLVFGLSACGGEKEKDAAQNTSVSYIGKTEAKIYFYEITSTYRCELMQRSEEELLNGVEPTLWKGVAEEVAEVPFSELNDTYINEEERTLLSTAYGANISSMTFGIYAVADLQKGIDELFGPGRIDVSKWNGNNLDIVARNIFGTSAGYFIYAKDDSKRFDTQIYDVVSVTGGEGKAVVKARAVSVDSITDQAVYDLSTLVESTDEAGTVTKSYKKLENAALENFDYGADFDTNISSMGISRSDLGVMEFVFAIDGISVYLDHIEMP